MSGMTWSGSAASIVSIGPDRRCSPRASLLPARVALLGVEQPWIGAFSRAVMDLNFARDREINTSDALAPILAGLGLPPEAILQEAQGEANKTRLRAQTEAAQARGVFGAPMMFVGEEMFWGNDRLDDALEFARMQL